VLIGFNKHTQLIKFLWRYPKIENQRTLVCSKNHTVESRAIVALRSRLDLPRSWVIHVRISKDSLRFFQQTRRRNHTNNAVREGDLSANASLSVGELFGWESIQL